MKYNILLLMNYVYDAYLLMKSFFRVITIKTQFSNKHFYQNILYLYPQTVINRYLSGSIIIGFMFNLHYESAKCK